MQITQDKQTILRAFKTLIKGIAFNNIHGDNLSGRYYKPLTHTEVINIAKSAIINGISSYFDKDIDEQIYFFLWSLTGYGLSHKERMNMAKQILELIKEQESRREGQELEQSEF